MEPEVFGLTEKLSQGKPIFGFTDTETVKLDFDDTPLKNVTYWADRTLNWFKLGGYIILKSSSNSYHVVFNRSVSWSKNMKVVAWVALLSKNGGLIRWLIMQCIKQSSTLRISNKNKKPSPRIVTRQGKQDKQIQEFLEYRKQLKNIIRTVEKPHQESSIARASKVTNQNYLEMANNN
jgi:hypothetical protein